MSAFLQACPFCSLFQVDAISCTLIKCKEIMLIISSLSNLALSEISVLDSFRNFWTRISHSHYIWPWLHEHNDHHFFRRGLPLSFENHSVIWSCYNLLLHWNHFSQLLVHVHFPKVSSQSYHFGKLAVFFLQLFDLSISL